MNTNIATRTINTIADTLGHPRAEVLPESKLIDELFCDSLDLLEIVLALEIEFEIDIDDHSVESMTTVQDFISHIEGFACAGKNCGCTDSVSHSAECIAEHEATIDQFLK